MTIRVNRRAALIGLVVGFVVADRATVFADTPLPIVRAYHNPACGCCHAWAKHMEAAGFDVTLTEDPDIAAKQKALGIPDALSGCHFSRIGSYLVVGHVPSEDVLRLLKEQPKVKGLTVPGMPLGSPGMDTQGEPERYAVLLMNSDGTSEVFSEH